MKAQKNIFKVLLWTGIFISLFACQKNDEVIPPTPGTIVEEDGISAEAFETYPGEIGIVINAREVARKGYLPAKVMVNVDAENGDYSQTISLDEFSFMGQLKIPVEGLGEAARNELIAGVPVSVTILDENDTPILSDVSLSSVSFLANPLPQNVNTSGLAETPEAATIDLNGGTDYYLQKVDEDGAPINMSMRFNQSPNYGYVMTVSTNNTFAGDQPDHVFNFEPVPGKDNTFYIRIAATNYLIYSNTVIAVSGITPVIHVGPKNSFTTSISNDPDIRKFYEFKIDKVKEGVYRILNYQGTPMKEASGIGLTFNHSSGKNVYWRLVSKEISWTVQSIATNIITPVLPAATTGFSFNSTLKNCGGGGLEQTVGADFSEQRSNTFGWSESISINNTSSQNVSTTVGVEFDAKFFGTGATYSASLTAGFEWSQSTTTENSTHSSETVTKTENYFTERTITVPSGSASLVYDVYQFYENVRVDYVQRLRLSGLDEDGQALSGKAIKSLFKFSRFNGVINQVEENSVVFTLRGHTVLDKFIETQSSVEDVPAGCK